MADLSSFQEDNGASLDSFKVEQETPVISNVQSNKNLAAHVVMMGEKPEEAITTFNEIMMDLGGTGSSKSVEDTLSRVKGEETQATKASLMELMVNPEVDDDTKVRATEVALRPDNDAFSARNILSSKALSLDNGEESVRQESVRVDIAGAINNVNRYKRDMQAIVNREVAKNDVGIGKAFMDIVGFMVPYTESARVADIVTEYNKEAEGGGNTASLVAEAITFMGSSKMDMKKHFNSMNLEERRGFAEALTEIIVNHDGIVLADDNDFAKTEFLRTFLEDGYYTGFDEFIDNAISLLDFSVLGGVVGRAVARPAQAVRRAFSAPIEIDADIQRAFSKPGAQPTSVASNLKEVNPEKSRASHDLALQDESGEAASALYGTTREAAIAGDILPEVASASGRVENKTADIGKDFDIANSVEADVMDFVNRDGTTYLWENEKRKLRASVYNDFASAEGVVLRTEASQLGEATSGGTRIRAIYGDREGGFRTAEEAREKVKLSLRDYGVADSEITILKRGDDGGYVEVKNLEGEGDFVARVDYDYKFNPFDPINLDDFSVSWNGFDRMQHSAPKSGTIQRHLLDIHSMINKEATLGANIAVDKAAGLESVMLELGKRFTDTFTSLPKNRQMKVEQYVKEANQEGLSLNYNKLIADGFNPEEVQALKNWRKYWDTVYWAENRDWGISLRSRGYKILEDSSSDTRLFAKPVKRNQVSGGAKVYDYRTDTVRKISNDELTALYKDGGEASKLRTPVHAGDDVAEYVITDNKAGGKYMRSIRDNDQILNYRNGYYQVAYDAPKYVVKRVKDKDGKVLYEKAIAVAGNTADASKRAKWHADSEGGVFSNDAADADFFVREDVKGTNAFHSDDYWNSQVSAGRSAQKARGERLEDASKEPGSLAENSFIVNPVDAMVNSARSVSRRVSMRSYIEAMKTRFMQQYGDMLPKNEFKQAMFPNRREDIQKMGDAQNKRAADARTVWEYINYLEGGYANLLDDGVKATLTGVARMFAKAGSTKGEEAALAATKLPGPTSLAKNAAFTLYLALNPVRQFIVQSHQAMLLGANFAPYMVSGGLARDMTAMISAEFVGMSKAAKAAGRTEAELAQMIGEFKRSGLAASVDKQNLIRGSLNEMVDEGKFRGKTRPIRGVIGVSRKLGFDAGEYVNIMSAWLAHRDKMAKTGRLMDDTALEEVSGLARNYTYNMNAAGDMPYNQNFLGIILQFMQVPHKAFTQVATNRVLSGPEKLRLLGYQAFMYSMPPAAMYSVFGPELTGNAEVDDAIVQGFEGYMFNKFLSMASGEKTSIDYGSLAPLDAHGQWDFITSLWTTDAGEILTNTPSGQLLFGYNPRITNAAKTVARWMNLMDDYEDPTEFSQVATDFLSMASGYSSAFQANYKLKVGQKMNAMGGITDEHVSTMEAVMGYAGLPTLDETKTRVVKNKLYEESKAFEDDVKLWYKDMKRHLTSKGVSNRDIEYSSKVVSEAWRAFDDNKPRAREIVKQLITRDIKQGDGTLHKSALRAMGMGDADFVRDLIKNMPNISDSQKETFLGSVDFVESYKEPK